MAEQLTATYPSKPVSAKQKDVDFAEHMHTYAGFMRLAKISLIALCALLVILFFTLVY